MVQLDRNATHPVSHCVTHVSWKRVKVLLNFDSLEPQPGFVCEWLFAFNLRVCFQIAGLGTAVAYQHRRGLAVDNSANPILLRASVVDRYTMNTLSIAQDMKRQHAYVTHGASLQYAALAVHKHG